MASRPDDIAAYSGAETLSKYGASRVTASRRVVAPSIRSNCDT